MDLRQTTRTNPCRLLALGLLLTLALSLTAAVPAGPTERHRPTAWWHARVVTEHPRLLFDADEIAGLRQRVSGTGVPAQAWERLRFQADQHLRYVRPELASQTRQHDGDPDYARPVPTAYGGQGQMPSILIELSFAYVLSGDEAYGRHAIDLMLALADAGWPTWRTAANAQPGLGAGDLARGVALAFDWTHDLLTPEEREALVSSLMAQLPGDDDYAPPVGINYRAGDHLLFGCLHPKSAIRTWVNNHQGVCGGGTGMLVLALLGEPGTETHDLDLWAERARGRTLQHLAGLPFPDQRTYGSNGDGEEGTVYAFYGLKNTLPFAHAWQRATAENITTLNPGLRNVPLWLSYEQLPGQGTRFVPRNDSTTASIGMHEVGPMFFWLRPDGVAGWLWDRTVGPLGDDIFASPLPPVISPDVDAIEHPEDLVVALIVGGGITPETFTILYYRTPAEQPRTSPEAVAPLSRHYPEHGLVTFRTGFDGGADEVAATFEAHRNSDGGHRQRDMGNFTLYGYGAQFAVDSGYTNSAGTNGSALGHNVVIINSSEFTQVAPGRLGTPETTILRYLDGPNQTFVRSDLRTGYATVTRGDPNEVPWADRRMLFSRTPGEPVLVAIADNIKRNPNGTPRYDWQMHTDGANITVPTGLTTFESVAPNGATMVGAFAEANGTTRGVTVHPYDKAANHAADPVTQNIIRSNDLFNQRQAQFDHVAVLAVTPPGMDAAGATTLTASGGSAVSVTWQGHEALVASAAKGSARVTSGSAVTLDGAFGKATIDQGESILDQGTSLSARGRDYITVTGQPATVIVSGDRIEAVGAGTNSYRVYAPQAITTVTVNGTPTAFTRDGDDITF